MSEDKKKILLSSSMVDLKAELFRKQEEFRQQKLANSEFVRAKKTEKSSKNTLCNRQNPGVQARAQQDIEDRPKNDEEEEMLLKSRKALEEKSKLYDKITHSSDIPEEDGSGYYLVDFQKKAIDSIVAERETKRREEEQEKEAEDHELASEIPEPLDPDQEWVEFTDSLGRQRCCMKKDLDLLLKKDKELALAQSKKNLMQGQGADDYDLTLPHLMSSDMHREMMRQKWENEAKELVEKSQNDIHYSNVQYDEIRNHGVGFFQFSKDHEKREEELDKLKSFRKETLEERSRKDHIKDKRKAMMEERLAKVRQRRKLKADVTEEANKEDVDFGPKLSEALTSPTQEEENTRLQREKEAQEAEERRKAHVREWDKEKVSREANFGVKPYLEKRRDERETEFAPPSIYFEKPNEKIQPLKISDKLRAKRLQQSLKVVNVKPEVQNIEQTLDYSQINLPDRAPSPVKDISSCMTSETYLSPETNYSNMIYPTASSSSVQTQSASTNMNSEIHHTWPGTTLPYVNNMSYNYPPPVNSVGGVVDFQDSMYNFHQYPAWYAHSTGRPLNSDFNNADTPQHTQPQVQPTHTVYNPVSDTRAGNSGSDLNLEKMEAPKKPKIPRMAIIDTRYVKNDDTTSADEMTPSSLVVTAVPYTPGSFTAAKIMLADQHNEAVMGSSSKQQISGGPLIYTAEQQEHQRKQNEAMGTDPDQDKKINEFLSSIRTGHI
ncbi:unnamed protein product [Lymnaea stagnalis]|uniref:CCDC174 alpha/beta GRSR domain-containing protein n=1 Tax=Lymnaea stagnalis TaxID=6523 RepID=A0AAV2IQ20_LYMST